MCRKNKTIFGEMDLAYLSTIFQFESKPGVQSTLEEMLAGVSAFWRVSCLWMLEQHMLWKKLFCKMCVFVSMLLCLGNTLHPKLHAMFQVIYSPAMTVE